MAVESHLMVSPWVAATYLAASDAAMSACAAGSSGLA